MFEERIPYNMSHGRDWRSGTSDDEVMIKNCINLHFTIHKTTKIWQYTYKVDTKSVNKQCYSTEITTIW